LLSAAHPAMARLSATPRIAMTIRLLESRIG
jgi:hypothetical protein